MSRTEAPQRRHRVALLVLAAVIAAVNIAFTQPVAHRLNLVLGAVLAVWAVVLVVARLDRARRSG